MRAFIYSLLCAAVVVCGCGSQPDRPEAQTDLYRSEVNTKSSDGKELIMTFQELRRDEKTSTVKVSHASGASVPSTMFVVRGCYDIARERNARYFVNLKEWVADDGGWMYVVGFANDNTVDIARYFELSEPFSQSHHFSAVKDYDLIFKNRP